MNRKELEQDLDFQAFLKKKYRYQNGLQILDMANNSPTKGQWRDVAKVDNGNGYLNVNVRYNKKAYHFFQHRLVFFLVNGYFGEIIDHKDRLRTNNNPNNLRSVTQSENCLNRISRSKPSGKTPYLGVSWKSSKSKYEAKITHERKGIYIGRSDCPIECARMRDEWIVARGLQNRYKLNFDE